MIIEIQGDIRDTDCEVIAHGVNCQNKMGSGVAKALYQKWPQVKESYHSLSEQRTDLKPEDKLGIMQPAYCRDKTILNCFTQLNYGYDGQLYVNYDAVRKCMKQALEFCMDRNIYEIALPKIGCGLAGGDWKIVRAILEETFPIDDPDFQVKVYYLK